MAFTEGQTVEMLIALINEGDYLVQEDSSGSSSHYVRNAATEMRIVVTPGIFRQVLGRVRHLCNYTRSGSTFTWNIPRE